MPGSPTGQWSPYVTADRIRKALDVFGDAPGSLLYRAVDRWRALAPGSEGQVLQVDEEGLPFWGSSGGGGFDSWTDDFEIAQPVSRNYVMAGTNLCRPVIGGGFLQFVNSGAASGHAALIAKKVVGADGLSQYCGATLISETSPGAVGARSWIGVLCGGDYRVAGAASPDFHAYVWVLAKDLGVSALQKVTSPTTNINLLSLGYPTPISEMELQAEIGTGQVTLRALVDGVEVGSVTDSSVPLTVGCPAIGNRSGLPTGFTTVWDNLRCGVL